MKQVPISPVLHRCFIVNKSICYEIIIIIIFFVSLLCLINCTISMPGLVPFFLCNVQCDTEVCWSVPLLFVLFQWRLSASNRETSTKGRRQRDCDRCSSNDEEPIGYEVISKLFCLYVLQLITFIEYR